MFIRRTLSLALVALATFTISGCDFIVGIFQAGFWIGVIAVIVIILVIWLIAQMFD